MNTTNRKHMKSSEWNVGIDVGKDTLDVYVYETVVHWQELSTDEGVRHLVERLKRYQLTRVLVEATGGYERRFVESAFDNDIPVIIVQQSRSGSLPERRTYSLKPTRWMHV
jgi:transposase